nr:RHS repeat-associated core domain-containing protein [Pseudomonas putida]HDS0967503.1 RHS repeat-associated core domain-containing protein [Pseudomonas putida]HDS0990607.1 RHS repeat-associated core domain-containing protein [Pseudomonas putida]HDS0993932.1 RHS repeat-associated core domain-containing protein [Pseudomonas putida]
MSCGSDDPVEEQSVALDGKRKAGTLQKFYCNNRLATEVQGALKFSIVQGEHQLLAQGRYESDVLIAALLANDQQQSVLNVAGRGALLQCSKYSAYGFSIAGGKLQSLLGFNGERPDPTTQHYFLGNGYRAFNPMLMRFNSLDGLSPFNAGGLNSYAYCLGDPINLRDPGGRFAIRTWFSRFLDRLAVKTGFGRSHKGAPVVYEAGVTTTHTQAVTFTRARSKSLPQIDRPGSNIDTKGWDVLAFHGSSSEHAASLMSGLDPSRAGANGLTMGDGFYASLTSAIPGMMAKNTAMGTGGSPQVFAVLTKNQARLKPGRDFMFGVRGKKPQNRNHLEIVIKKEAYHLIAVRAADLRSEVSLPKSHEAPF